MAYTLSFILFVSAGSACAMALAVWLLTNGLHAFFYLATGGFPRTRPEFLSSARWLGQRAAFYAVGPLVVLVISLLQPA